MINTKNLTELLDQLNNMNYDVEKNFKRCEFILDAVWATQFLTLYNDVLESKKNLTDAEFDKLDQNYVIDQSKYLMERIEHVSNRAEIMRPIRKGNPGLFRKTENIDDIEKFILSFIDIKSLISMKITTWNNNKLVDEIVDDLIIALNSNKITPRDLGIKTLDALITLLSNKRSKIDYLDLRGITNKYEDSEKIHTHFQHIKHLFLNNFEVTGFLYRYLSKMTSLETLTMENCEYGNTKIKALPSLKSLSFTSCQAEKEGQTVIKLGFLENFSLEHLSLASSYFENFPICLSLKSLDLTGCKKINLIEILKNCPNLEELNISKKYTYNTYTRKSRNYKDINLKEKEIGSGRWSIASIMKSIKFKPGSKPMDFSPMMSWAKQGTNDPIPKEGYFRRIVRQEPEEVIDFIGICQTCPSIKTIIAKDLVLDEHALQLLKDKKVKVIQ